MKFVLVLEKAEEGGFFPPEILFLSSLIQHYEIWIIFFHKAFLPTPNSKLLLSRPHHPGRMVVRYQNWTNAEESRHRYSGWEIFWSRRRPIEARLENIETVVLAKDDYILPGIFDLHANYNVNLFGKRRKDEVQVNPIIFLANGVTSTFPAGEYDPEDMLELRKRI